LLRRGLPLIVFAAGAFAFGVYEAGADGRAQRTMVADYVRDWAQSNYRAMYQLLSPSSRRQLSLTSFTADYVKAMDTATVVRLAGARQITVSGRLGHELVVVHTSVFGTLRGMLTLRFAADDNHFQFSPTMLFPGLRAGERLARTSSLGARGTILASDGTPLAQGPTRTSPIPSVANEVVGQLGSIPVPMKAIYASEGYPADAQVGLNGLEAVFQQQLAGTPGGSLLAGRRVLANVAPKPGQTVRTTIDPKLETAAIAALGPNYGGITVLNPATGGIEAAAGLAWSDVQPPGSTFKIVTATAVLQFGLAKLGSEFPQQSAATLDGYTLQNAGGEVCGGTLISAFANSCNSTYAPLGAQLGAKRLLAVAEKFGFNSPPTFAGELESTLPASSLGSDLENGSAAIGQGQDEASTVQMADVGAAIADGGRRPVPTLDASAAPKFVQVTTPAVAAEVQQMMEAVVSYGTGVTAQIPGVKVAGKTGTAELANTANQQNNTQDTDGWFVGYAPVGAPKAVACALFPNAGYGEDTAAPAVRQVLEAALQGG
jgi:cell division protein FtsI/penicillin-binding protein 2